MQTQNKSRIKFVMAVFLAFMLGCTATYAVVNSQFWLNGHRPPKAVANVYFRIENEAGVFEFQSGNVITDIGENYIRDILGFDNVTGNNATKWLALGNATVAQTLTKLGQEATTNGFARALGTVAAWMNGTDYAYNVSKTFTVSGLGAGEYISVNASALHWNDTPDSDGNAFAVAYLTDGTQHQFTNTSNCTVTWVITFDAN